MKKKRNIIILQTIVVLSVLFIIIENLINFNYDSIYSWFWLFVSATTIGVSFLTVIIFLINDIEKYFKNKNKE